ncbi:hypothetical protein QTP88_015177 [Uroleucon formosanum]
MDPKFFPTKIQNKCLLSISVSTYQLLSRFKIVLSSINTITSTLHNNWTFIEHLFCNKINYNLTKKENIWFPIVTHNV